MSESTVSSYECVLKEEQAQPALCVRARTSVKDFPLLLGRIYGDIAGYLSELGEYPSGPPFVAYYNMDMEALDVDVGMPVARELSPRGEIRLEELPQGKYASCIHKGPYAEIPAAYESLSQWMQQNGHQSVGVAYEFYLNDPQTTAPQELLTEVRFLLK
jgi:effector-binding domain-containing protein